MTQNLRLVSSLFLVALLGGCATTGEHTRVLCTVAGAVIGGALGAVADDEAEIAAAGAAGGALAGWLACGKPTSAPASVGDADGDGVNDDNDACPGTPRGARVDARGCPMDGDGDGVYDGLDRCPNTQAGVAVDGNGCPLDSDGDGVTDNLDQCPNTPRGVAVDARGCPQVGERILRLEGIKFALDSAEVSADSRSILDQAVQTLRNNAVVRVRVEGHADSRGADQYNQRLSERRAQAVVDYLTTQGIPRDRMDPMGFGESMPVAPNDTEENMARNRRVDFVVTE